MGVIDFVIMLTVVTVSFILGRMNMNSKSFDKEVVKEAPQQVICSPQITVVFQQNIEDDEDLCREVADMYLSNRAFYYSGKDSSQEKLILSEKEIDVFIRFNDVDFSKLQKINI